MNKKKSALECELIWLPKIGDRKGHITAVNNFQEVPFEIKRVFYLYDNAVNFLERYGWEKT